MIWYRYLVHLLIVFFLTLSGLTVYYHGEHLVIYLGFAFLYIIRLYFINKYST